MMLVGLLAVITFSPAADDFTASMQPFTQKYCLGCHSTAAKKGSLDLQRFKSSADLRGDVKIWQQTIEMLEASEMPPKGKAQPTAAERNAAIRWIRSFLDHEARSSKGDPGPSPLRRLSNAEYDYTIHDLTGVDLRPTREFPPDGAGGEGFTNAAESLSDISPTLFTKYLNAAKEIADHAILLPDGFRFSPKKSRRDWSDENVERLRAFYHRFTPNGDLPVKQYVAALIKHREALKMGTTTPTNVAEREKLNAKYLGVLWKAVSDPKGEPLRSVSKRILTATDKEIDAVVTEVANHQKASWKVVPVGSYRDNAASRQVADDSKAKTPEQKQGFAEFRQVFPMFICLSNVIPTDEVVCLKMFHREDEPLERLFLTDADRPEVDRLWRDQSFISRQAIAENDYLPQFIGFVTQDQPKELLAFFEGQRPAFKKRSDDLRAELEAAVPTQLDRLVEFAAQAFRRPLTSQEKKGLRKLYRTLRGNEMDHEQALCAVLAKVLASPAFLMHIEQSPTGKEPKPLNDWELASRLSYFLWSSAPDQELRSLAADGRLGKPEVLEAQTKRMLKDPKVRRLAVEFGTQSLHVRNFEAFNEKNEKLFPTFNADLRKAMEEEATLFFQDFFTNDRKVSDLLEADRAFLNETLAKHYGVPNVEGSQFRLVSGVRQFGRGGVLGLGSVLAKQSAASRTSPVLRGNWVVETLLGEKLPRPPANVPQLPEMENSNGLSMRQQVELHAKAAECAVCHVRIDPFGFALEQFDAVGRKRDRDQGGLPIDAHGKLKDGTEFDGVDGLRNYLLTQKRDVFVRLFCKRLLGYALGRSVLLSDTSLLDEMVAELEKNDGRVSAALLAVVRSPQFRMRRGNEVSSSQALRGPH
jgi:hypothetical protein